MDFNGRGVVTRKQIVDHLGEKYGNVNPDVLRGVLAGMKWNERDEVTK